MRENAVCWFDIPVKNLERAIKFYSAVLSEKIEVAKHDSFTFAVIPCKEDGVAGCLVETEESKPSADGVLIYLSVEGRLDDAVVESQKMGGKLLIKKEQIGPWGYRAVILDSEGNKVALHSN